jgi:hypothetical protein
MAKTDDCVETPNCTDFTGILRENEWCCQTGLNCRPLHYQWSALPLSYGSMPRIKGIGPKGLSRRADPCHKGSGFASAARRFGALKTAKSARNRPLSPPFADIAAKIQRSIAAADDKSPTAAKLALPVGAVAQVDLLRHASRPSVEGRIRTGWR